MLDSATCIPMQVVGFRLTHVYYVDLLIRIISVSRCPEISGISASIVRYPTWTFPIPGLFLIVFAAGAVWNDCVTWVEPDTVAMEPSCTITFCVDQSLHFL